MLVSNKLCHSLELKGMILCPTFERNTEAVASGTDYSLFSWTLEYENLQLSVLASKLSIFRELDQEPC